MIDFSSLFVITGIFCFLLISSVLFFWTKPKNQAYPSKLLSATLFCAGWCSFILIIIINGFMKSLPWLHGYRTAIFFLIPPLCYLYVRSVIYGETHIKKRDWVHFIPFILSLLTNIPFYFSGMNEKIRVVNAISENLNNLYTINTGLIPNLWYYMLRPVQSLAYLLPMWWLAHTYLLRPTEKQAVKLSKKITRWLLIFILFQTLVCAGQVVAAINSVHHISLNLDIMDISKTRLIWQGGLFLILSFYILFTPQILYGTYPTTQTRRSKHGDKNQKLLTWDDDDLNNEDGKEHFSLTDAQLSEYTERVNSYINGHESFRSRGITINDLATSLEMSPRTLSYLINQHYGQRFTDFINHYRVEYIKQRINNGDNKTITLEGLAMDAGFSSRSAFFTAFKKSTGLNPTEYVRSLKTDAVPHHL